jgi:hypothetical protein
MEDMISQLYQYNMGLPLQYANPYFAFLNSQAGNMAGMGNQYQSNVGSLGNQAIGQYGSLGGQAMGLYGQLAGQQSDMYRTELPIQMEAAKYNSLAPALSGLLGQFGGFSGANISPINMQYNRPDVMGGYQGAVGGAYGQLQNAVGGAYGQANNAYTQARGDLNRVGDQFGQQWNDLQGRVFPKQQGGGYSGGMGGGNSAPGAYSGASFDSTPKADYWGVTGGQGRPAASQPMAPMEPPRRAPPPEESPAPPRQMASYEAYQMAAQAEQYNRQKKAQQLHHKLPKGFSGNVYEHFGL